MSSAARRLDFSVPTALAEGRPAPSASPALPASPAVDGARKVRKPPPIYRHLRVVGVVQRLGARDGLITLDDPDRPELPPVLATTTLGFPEAGSMVRASYVASAGEVWNVAAVYRLLRVAAAGPAEGEAGTIVTLEDPSDPDRPPARAFVKVAPPGVGSLVRAFYLPMTGGMYEIDPHPLPEPGP